MRWAVTILLCTVVGILAGEFLGIGFAIFILREIEFSGEGWKTYLLAVHIGSPILGFIAGLFLWVLNSRNPNFDFKMVVRRIVTWVCLPLTLIWILCYLMFMD